MSYLPIGYRFRPTDVELVVNYLASKIMGQPLPCECIPVMDLYSGDPWMTLHNNQTHWDETDCDVKGNVTQITTYLFTQLTPKKKDIANKKQAHGDHNNDKTRENYIRTAGCGTWRPQNCKDVFNRQGQLVGFKRYLTFETNKKKSNTKNPSTLPSGHHYTMHEFSLARGESTFVLCQISLSFKTGKISTASFYDRQVSCVNEDEITRVSKRARSVGGHPLVSQVTSIPVEDGDRIGPSFSGDFDEEIYRVLKRARSLDDHQFGSNSMDRYVVDQCNPDEIVDVLGEHSNNVQVQLPLNIAPENYYVGNGTAHGYQANDQEQLKVMKGSRTVDIDGIQQPLEETDHMEAAAQPIHAAENTNKDDDGLITFLEQLSNDNNKPVQKSLTVTKADYVNGGILQPLEETDHMEAAAQPIHAAENTTKHDDGPITFLEQLSNDNIKPVQKSLNVTKADYVNGGILQPLEETDHMEAAAQPIHAAENTTKHDDGLISFLEQLSNYNIKPVQKSPTVTKSDYVNGGILQPCEDQEQLLSSSGNDDVDDGMLHLLDFDKGDEPYWSCLELKDMSCGITS